jgi:carbonic anhydrase
MREIVWQITDTETVRDAGPTDARTARRRLERGSEAFTALFDAGSSGARRIVQLAPEELGISPTGDAPDQRPFAMVLSCADARVPVEMLLSQRANDLFVVRVAGGVLGESAMGSLDYAVARLPTVHLALVLGHTRCGAVTAAVDTYLHPDTYVGMGDSRPLLALVHNLLGPVRLAAHTLEEVHGREVVSRPGYRDALVEMAVVANAGVVAAAIAARSSRRAAVVGRRVDTGFAVYDLVSRGIGVPGSLAAWVPGIVDAPGDPDAFSHWLREVAFGPRVSTMLEAAHEVR